MILILIPEYHSIENISNKALTKVFKDYKWNMLISYTPISMTNRRPLNKSAEDFMKLSNREKPSIGPHPIGILKVSLMHWLYVIG